MKAWDDAAGRNAIVGGNPGSVIAPIAEGDMTRAEDI
jgi:hypothetical protein